MNNTLTQEQLNGARIISALAELIVVNTNPKYGWGKETFDIVINHVKNWPYQNRKDLKEFIDRLDEAKVFPISEKTK